MAGFGNIRLLISDVDGTLVNSEKRLTERTRLAVLALRKKGIRFAITSSRPPRGMAMFVAPLELEEPIAGFNGGAIATPSMDILEVHTLSTGVARSALDHMESFDLESWLFLADEWLVTSAKGPHVEREIGTVQFLPREVPDFAPFLAQSTKLVGVSDDYPRVERAEQEVQSVLGGKASASRSQNYYLDVTPPAANKGCVVGYHARRLGIPMESICAIGDGANDVYMFEKSGFSIAMGNAADAVKAKAQQVTDTNDADGLATAIERFLLG